jgi:hypothetical protein
MATRTRTDESLVERDEVLFPDTNLIDTEPHYNNFTTIQNALRRQDEEQKQINIVSLTSRKRFDISFNILDYTFSQLFNQ